MKQTTNAKNVWDSIHRASSRRIISDGEYNFFWICDEKGRYGLLISLAQRLSDKELADKIRGITIIKDAREKDGTDVYLILNDSNDWEIFYSLCTDLLIVSEKSSSESSLITNLKKRLKRWQLFLSEDNSLSLSEARQMGLITELLCLKEVILPRIPAHDAVISWVGPDFDRQDFSLTNLFIEVKSYISSKGAIVSISSLHQLVHNIKPLYLVAYGLSRNNNGTSVKDAAAAIGLLLGNESEGHDLFEQKLAEYGYIDGVTQEPFYKYSIDDVKCFAVTDEFPKILPEQVQEQIMTAQYTIDLTRCSRFETDLMSIFK